MKKKDKTVMQDLNNIKAPYQESRKSGGNELLQFFIGIILLGARIIHVK